MMQEWHNKKNGLARESIVIKLQLSQNGNLQISLGNVSRSFDLNVEIILTN